MIITVIGGKEPTPEIEQLAEQVGVEIGKRGAYLLCGGLGGVMEAACRGAKSTGGTTIGIMPGNDPESANPWVDIPICTGMHIARNVIVVKSGNAVIAIGGAYGTLSEIGHALSMGIPVIGLKTWELSRNGIPDQGIIIASNAKDAVEKAMEAAAKRLATTGNSVEGILM